MDFERWIRDVDGFPKPGIVFKDLTPLLGDVEAFRAMVEALVAPFRSAGIERICGIEARGFIFGAAAALTLGCGFVPMRKPGKLPAARIGVDYALEYGSDRLEMHADALAANARVLLIDDVLATGGTLLAGAELVERAGASLVAAAVVAEIPALGGRARWARRADLHAVIRFG